MIEFEEVCDNCDGAGEVTEYGPPYNRVLRVLCRTCNGWGVVPNEDGEAILKMLAHQIHVTAKDRPWLFPSEKGGSDAE